MRYFVRDTGRATDYDTEERVMASVQVRYIVNDVDAAIKFYCELLGFHEDMHPAPTFAMLSRGDLRLVLSQPGSGREAAAGPCPTAKCLHQADGTASPLKSPMLPPPWRASSGRGSVPRRRDRRSGRQSSHRRGSLRESDPALEPKLPEARLNRQPNG